MSCLWSHDGWPHESIPSVPSFWLPGGHQKSISICQSDRLCYLRCSKKLSRSTDESSKKNPGKDRVQEWSISALCWSHSDQRLVQSHQLSWIEQETYFSFTCRIAQVRWVTFRPVQIQNQPRFWWEVATWLHQVLWSIDQGNLPNIWASVSRRKTRDHLRLQT